MAGSSSQGWRGRALALWLVLGAAALAALVFVQSGTGDASELLWAPKTGPLTKMIREARVEQAELKPKAKKQMLADKAPSMSRTTALSWARRQLEHGSSSAEGQDRPQSAYSRNYGHGMPGYTSDTRETVGSASAEAQQFATLISDRANEREDKQTKPAAREMQLADASDSTMFSGEKQTSMARETRAGADTKSWSWASGMSKSSALALKSKMPPGMHTGPLTTAVRESRTSPEQSAWTWAAAHFDRDAHRDRVTMPKQQAAAPQEAVKPKTVVMQASKPAVHKAPAVVQQPVQPKPAPVVQAVQHKQGMKNASPRAAKLLEAHRALQRLHKATLSYEHNKYAKKAAEESFRAKEIADREASSEQAADEGADAEFDEYSEIASAGIPSGAQAATTSENEPYAFREEARYRPSRAEEMHRAHRARGHRGRRVQVSQGNVQDLAHQVEQAYRKGFSAGMRSEEKAIDDAETRQMRATAAKRMKARQAKKAKADSAKTVAAQDAREQSLAGTWDDADSDFQVDGGNWGPGSGDWA